jgi:hypothetical protein
MNKPSKRYAAFFAKSGRFLRGLKDFSEGGNVVEGMSLTEFDENYVYVGTYTGQNPDDVFSLLQSGGGGLGVEVSMETMQPKRETLVAGHMMQELLIRKIGHTSMSKGDVLVDLETGDVLLCASVGWDKMVITGMRSLESAR